jgi:hypothetical protein
VQRPVAIVCADTEESKISKWAVCTLAKLAEVPSILRLLIALSRSSFSRLARMPVLAGLLLEFCPIRDFEILKFFKGEKNLQLH